MNTKPQNISELIALIESNNNQYAMRYEPMYKPSATRVSQYAKMHGVSLATAHVCLASSWGLYQIMGDNLMSYGLALSMPHYCASLATQQLYFQRFLNSNNIYNLTADYQSFILDDGKIEQFARVYNGPGNVDAYVARMKEFM